jgi:glycosyltransferase involved in cell wall biosynthesis
MFEEAGCDVLVAGPDFMGRLHDIRQSDETSGPSWRKVPNLIELRRNSLKAVRLFNPDAIIAHNYEPGLVALSIKRPFIYCPHGLLQREITEYAGFRYGGSIIRSIAGTMEARIIRRAETVITLTPALADYFQSRFKHHNTHFIPAPFYADDFGEFPDPTKTGNSLFYSGNADGYQNLPALMRAIEICNERIRGINLVICTNSPEGKWRGLLPDSFKYQIHNSPGLAETARLAREAEIAVISRTDHYGYPMKIHFYVNCRLPIAAFDCGQPGLIHGKTAMLADAGDPRSLADVICILLKDKELRNSLAGQVYNNFAEWFNPWYIIEEFKKFI